MLPLLFIASLHSVMSFETGLGGYNVEIYNDLPDFFDTSHNGILLYDAIESLGQLFIKHQVDNDFGLSLLHKVIYLSHEHICFYVQIFVEITHNIYIETTYIAFKITCKYSAF